MFEVIYEDWVGNRPVRVRAWSDLVVFREYGCSDSHSKYAQGYVLSVAGPDSAVKAVASAVCEHRRVVVVGRGGKEERLNLDAGAGSWRVFASRAGDAAHAVCVHESCLAWVQGGRVLLAWDGDLEEAFWRFLRAESPVPVLREWTAYLLEQSRERYWLTDFAVWGQGVAAVRVSADLLPGLQGVVCKGVKSGKLRFPAGLKKPSPDLAHLKGMDEYLKRYGPELGRQVVRAFVPRYDPVKEEPGPLVGTLRRRPYRAQADAVEGLVRTLRERRSAVLVGECGVGKTLAAAAVAYALWDGRPYRVLVMAPNHLVRKWKREVEETVPGARAQILSDWRQVLSLRELPKEPSCPEYYILARDTAKLGFYWKPAALWREGTKKGKRKGWHCPDCGRLLVDRDGVPFPKDEFSERRKRNLKCSACGSSLWQADGSRVRKAAPVDLVKKYLKRRRFFQLLVGDEVHELKGDTAQGIALGVLSGAARKTLVLTGTLLNGYASSLHYILHRLDPDALVREGIGYGEVQKWVERYGVLERVTKTSGDEDYNWSSRGKKSRVSVRERPGVSPLLFLRHLLGSTVFLELADLGCQLPEYREEVHLVDMDPELAMAYCRFAGDLKAEVQACLASGSRRLLGTYLQNLLSYPDRPWDNPPVVDPRGGKVICEPPELPRVLREKERALLELVRSELSRGRRVFVYVTYTQKRDIQARLKELLESAGIRAAVLSSSVPPVRREEWLEEQCLQGVQVVVAQSRLVETGLDLTGNKNFPTLCFYQTGYNLYTLRQASRRSWRIGQTEPVRVVFLAYRDTLQEAALQLMGSKLEAALLLEGKFSEEGLLALSSGEDVAAELARALVQGLEGVDSAEQIWRRVSGVPVQEEERAAELIALSDFFRKRKKASAVQLGFSFLLSPDLVAAGK